MALTKLNTNAIETSGFSDLKSGRKNLIINGGFDVWQRGTSFTADGYSADRTYTFATSRGGDTVSRSTDVPTDEGFQYSMKWVFAAAHGLPFYRQRIENFSTVCPNGKVKSISFWAKASTAMTIQTDLGDVSPDTHSITTSWQRFTSTVPANSNPTFDALDIQSNSVTGTLYITGVQLELGDTATDFEHRSYGEELALCQRYFYSTPFALNTYSTTSSSLQMSGARHKFADVSGYRSQIDSFPVTMRVTPSITFYNGNDGTAGQMYLYDHNGSTQNFAGFVRVYGYGVKFNGYTGVTVGTNGYSCECWVSYIADAEL